MDGYGSFDYLSKEVLDSFLATQVVTRAQKRKLQDLVREEYAKLVGEHKKDLDESERLLKTVAVGKQGNGEEPSQKESPGIEDTKSQDTKDKDTQAGTQEGQGTPETQATEEAQTDKGDQTDNQDSETPKPKAPSAPGSPGQ